MRKIVALILVVSAFVALIAPECAVSLYSRSQNMNFSFTYFTSDVSLADSQTASDEYLDVDDSHEKDRRGGETSHVCDHCHFGHCGIIVAQVRPQLMELGSPHGSSSKTLVLKSFVSSLFRPPIA